MNLVSRFLIFFLFLPLFSSFHSSILLVFLVFLSEVRKYRLSFLFCFFFFFTISLRRRVKIAWYFAPRRDAKNLARSLLRITRMTEQTRRSKAGNEGIEANDRKRNSPYGVVASRE